MADNVLKVTTQLDVGPLKAGMAEAASATQQGADQMAEALKRVTAASAALNAAQAEVAAIVHAVGGSISEGNAAWGVYIDAQQRAAQAAADLAAAQAEEAVASTAQTAASEAAAAGTAALGAEARAAASAQNALNSSMSYGSARMIAAAGGAGSMGYALASVARNARGLQPLLDAIFPVAAAAVMADIVANIAESVKNWYDNAVDLKALNDSLMQGVETQAKAAATANYQYLAGQIEILRETGRLTAATALLQKTIGEKPLNLKFSLPKDELSQAERLLGGIQSIIGQINGVSTLAEGKGLAGAITGQIGEAENALKDLQTQLQQQQGQLQFSVSNPTAAGAASGAGLTALSQEAENTQAKIRALTSTVAELKGVLGQVASEEGAAGNAIEESANRAAKAQTEAAARAQKAAEEGAARLREIDKQNATLEKDLQDRGLAQLTQHVAASVAAAQRGADREAQAILDALRKIEDAGSALHDFWEEQALDAPSKFWASWTSLGDAAMAQMKSDADAVMKTAEKAKPLSIVGPGDALQKSFSHLGSAFDTMMNGVLMGTQRMSVAFRRMGADMAASFIESMAKIEITNLAHEMRMTVAHIAGTQARVAATAAGSAEESSIGLIATLKAVNRDAVKAAGGAYSALVGIPIIGPVIAPIAAGVAFAGVEAFGALASAEGGQWRVPFNEQLTMLHRNEMVLPAAHAEALRQQVSGGGGSPRPIHFHYSPQVQAVDARGVGDMLQRHGDLFAAAMHRHLRKANAI